MNLLQRIKRAISYAWMGFSSETPLEREIFSSQFAITPEEALEVIKRGGVDVNAIERVIISEISGGNSWIDLRIYLWDQKEKVLEAWKEEKQRSIDFFSRKF